MIEHIKLSEFVEAILKALEGPNEEGKEKVKGLLVLGDSVYFKLNGLMFSAKIINAEMSGVKEITSIVVSNNTDVKLKLVIEHVVDHIVDCCYSAAAFDHYKVNEKKFTDKDDTLAYIAGCIQTYLIMLTI